MTRPRPPAEEPPPTEMDALLRAQQVRRFRVAVGMCGDPDLAEEAVAEAFARSWPAIRRGSVDDPPAYLRRAVINALNGRFRRAVLERRAQSGERDRDRAPDAEGAVVERDAVVRALQQLPARQRAVMVLRHYEGLAEAEVAAVMGLPIGTVKSTASRASARLRVLLEDDRYA